MKINYTLAKITGLLLMSVFSSEMSAQLMSVKTNALMWGNATPNLSVELVTSKKTSLEISGLYSLDKTPLKTGLKGVQAEMRYWLSGRPMNWMFVGMGITGLRYDSSLGKNTRHVGDAIGPGIVCGYALPLGKHWNIEFATGLGLMWYRERKYGKDIDIYSQPYNKSGRKIMPTKLTVACAYVF